MIYDTEATIPYVIGVVPARRMSYIQIFSRVFRCVVAISHMKRETRPLGAVVHRSTTGFLFGGEAASRAEETFLAQAIAIT